MTLPRALLVHVVTVEPYSGTGARGPAYGAPFPLQCMAQGQHKLVRDSDGQQRLSTLQLFAQPDQAAAVPPGSLVTWQGRTTTVMQTVPHDSGALGAPDHTEVVCE